MNIEQQRLADCTAAPPGWKKWGPYLSERQWGTVREDYSAHGNAWDYLPHDHARSRAYRWGEDGIAGFSDDNQILCLSLALWNERDPILKERLFGLTNSEGNHGEDVKELYYYLDATPTHSYLRMLYKYPQAAFPYAALAAENRRRGIGAPAGGGMRGHLQPGQPALQCATLPAEGSGRALGCEDDDAQRRRFSGRSGLWLHTGSPP